MFKRAISVSLLLSFLLVAGAGLSFAQSVGQDYAKFMKEGSTYAKLAGFLRLEQQRTDTSRVEAKDIVIVNAIDFFFSALCLWTAILVMTGVKVLEIKKYLWFVLAVTLCWYCMLVGFKLFWGMLDFLVIRLRPELKDALVDFFSISILTMAVLTYIWLLARTFGLGFVGSLSVFGLSHIIYFAAIFIFAAVAPVKDRYCELIRFHMGLAPSIQAYLRDLYKLVSSNNILVLLRLRFYHF